METLPLDPFKVVIDGIKESGGEAFKYCYQCGKCDTVCPWNYVRNFLVRKIINQSKFGVVPFESEDVWLCATCGKCPPAVPPGCKDHRRHEGRTETARTGRCRSCQYPQSSQHHDKSCQCG